MPLKINNTDITNLYINGTEQNVLRVNNTAYFGKRYWLTQNSSTGVSFSISRSDSPNQRASTGSISTGNPIYYGDVITISVSANANYTNPILYVNMGSGMTQRSSPFTFTVGDNVTYYGSATYADSWRTVWTGSQTFTSSGSFTVPGLASGGDVQVTATAQFGQILIGSDGYEEFLGNFTGSVNRRTLPCYLNSNYTSIYLSRNGNQIVFDLDEYSEYMKGFTFIEYPISITITEVRRMP